MFLKKTEGPRVVRLPDGQILTLADLPEANVRWVAQRKAQVVRAVKYGLLTREQAMQRYALSDEEFDLWLQNYSRGGVSRLKIRAIDRSRQL